MAYAWWGWDSDWAGFRVMTTDVTIHDDPGDFSDEHGIYLMLGLGSICGAVYYYGIQTDVRDPVTWDGRGKGLIFSRWQTRDLAHARAADDGFVQSSGHGGDFIGVRRGYDWTAGEYRLRLAPDGDDADGEWFGLWITDLEAGDAMWIGSLRFPCESQALISPGSYSTIEIYGAPIIRPIDIPEIGISIAPPEGDGIAASSAFTGYASFSGEIMNSEARCDAESGRIYLQAGGLTERKTGGDRRISLPC